MLVVIGIHEESKSYTQIESKFRVCLRLNRRALLTTGRGASARRPSGKSLEHDFALADGAGAEA